MSVLLKIMMAPGYIAANQRNKWSRTQVLDHQKFRLSEVLSYARKHSPYYREALPTDNNAALTDLPILTKTQLYENWDQLVTTRLVRRDSVLNWLSKSPGPRRRYRGIYRAMATSGSTGERTPFVYSMQEWAEIMVSVARLSQWRGGLDSAGEKLVSILNTAKGSNAGAPISYLIGDSLQNLTKGGEILDQSRPIGELVAALNEIQPNALSSFASTLTLLAEAQLRGDLNLTLKSVNSSSEVLSREAALLIERAFKVQPHNAHAMTECGVLAASCNIRAGMHLLDDMTIVECVDKEYRPVEKGRMASRVLITNLWARTLPLIRFEVTDQLLLSEFTCDCDLPFPLIESVEGRSAEILRLPGRSGQKIPISAWQVQRALYGRSVLLWQIIWDDKSAVLKVVRDKTGSNEDLSSSFIAAMHDIGVSTDYELSVEYHEHIQAENTGKVKRFLPRSLSD